MLVRCPRGGTGFSPEQVPIPSDWGIRAIDRGALAGYSGAQGQIQRGDVVAVLPKLFYLFMGSVGYCKSLIQKTSVISAGHVVPHVAKLFRSFAGHIKVGRLSAYKGKLTMQMNGFILASLILALSLVGDSAIAQTAPKSPPMSATQDIEKRLKAIEFQVKSLQDRVAFRSATLDCNTGKYDEFLFNTGVLVFFAACTKIEPYLEGHRITVSVGNPHSFNFSNVKGALNYGKDWVNSLEKKVDVSITDAIRGASWTTVTIIVNPSKAEDMRYLSLSLNAETAGASR